MEVILLNDVEALGLRGEVVNVARGYARNFLLPRRLAEPATPAKVAELRKREDQRALHEARSVDQAQEMAKRLEATVLRFEVKSGPTGSLFGSVTPTQIADELWRTRKIRVDRRKIEIDGIKRIGRYDVPIELFQDVRVEVKTHVVPEGGELPSEDELAAMEAEERGEPEAPAAEAEALPAEEELVEEEPVDEEPVEEETAESGAMQVEAEPEQSEQEAHANLESPAQPEAVEEAEAAETPEPAAEPEPADEPEPTA
jgi:large subunit ribosomal protein L9